jgi:hypothetical protein
MTCEHPSPPAPCAARLLTASPIAQERREITRAGDTIAIEICGRGRPRSEKRGKVRGINGPIPVKIAGAELWRATLPEC